MRARLGQLTTRFDDAGLGVGGPGPLVGLTALAVLRAVALVVIAESIAIGVTALANGTDAWRDASVLGAAAVLARAALGWASQTVAARLAIRSTERVRRGVVARALDAPGETGGGTVVLATSGLDELDAYYRQVVPAAVSAAVVPLVIGLRILGTDWLSALIIALTLPLVPLFMVLIGMHTRDRVDRATGALERLGDHLVELARGLPVLVGLGRVGEQTRALARIQDEYRERTLATLRVAFLSALALELIGTISVALVAVAIGLRLVEGQLGLEIGLAALILAPEVYAAVREVGVAFHAAQGGLGALRRARDVVREPADADWRRVGGTDAHVDALTVRYPGRDDAAASGVTAAFPAGSITALTGPSGAGKSTVLAALVGALSAEAEVQGAVRVPRGPIAYAAQAPRLVAASAAEELALTGASAGEIERMLAVLDLGSVAGRHPALLSPGERRRVAVARALLLAPGAVLVVLDEPTAHLDAAHAEQMRLEVGRLRTDAPVVLVSHEPETVALADIRIPITPPAPGAPAHAAAAAADPVAVVRFSGDPADERPAAPVISAHRAETSGETTHSEPSAASTAGAESAREAAVEPARMPILARASLAILLGVAATGFGMALSAVSGWLIVRASEQPDLMYLLVAIVGVRFFGIGRAVARYAERLVTHDAVFRASDALRLRVWRAIAARGAASARLREGGTAVDYLVTLVHEVRDLAPRVIAPIVVGVLSVIGVVITTAFVLPELTLVVALALVIGVGLAVLVTALTDRRGAAPRLEARSAHTAALAALLRGADEVRASGLAPAALAELDRLADRSSCLARRAARAEGAGAAVAVVALVGLAVAVPSLAAPLVAAGATSAPTVAVIALLALAALDPALALVEATRLTPRLLVSWRRLSALRAPAADAAAAPDEASSTEASRGLVLTDLAARWPGADELVFEHVSAQVDRGEWLQVSGPSGAGKSTLLTVLLGGLRPASGDVRLDGAPIEVASDDAIAGEERRQVAWCPQDALLFSSTIRANLRIARPRGHEPSDESIREVLDRVGLRRLLASMPTGLDTRVGAGGAALSGGERQRLAVARALLTDAEVVLLDEPTAHLDADGAAALISDLRRATADRIVVLVSHRAADAESGDARILLSRAAEDPSALPTTARFEPLASVR